MLTVTPHTIDQLAAVVGTTLYFSLTSYKRFKFS